MQRTVRAQLARTQARLPFQKKNTRSYHDTPRSRQSIGLGPSQTLWVQNPRRRARDYSISHLCIPAERGRQYRSGYHRRCRDPVMGVRTGHQEHGLSRSESKWMAACGALPPQVAGSGPFWSELRSLGRAAVVKRPGYSRFARRGCTDRASPGRRRGGARFGSRRCRGWRASPWRPRCRRR